MASANVYHFSIGTHKHSFKIDIPPSAYGHSLRVTVDATKNKGSVTVLRNANTRDDCDCDCDDNFGCDHEPHPNEHSLRHNEQSLNKSMQNLRPFDAPTTPTRAAAYRTSHSAFLSPDDHRTENSARRAAKTSDRQAYYATRQDLVSTPQRHYEPQAAYVPNTTEADELPTWAELADQAGLLNKGRKAPDDECRGGRSKGREVPDNVHHGGWSKGQEVPDDVHHGGWSRGQQVSDEDHESTPANDPSHPSNLHVPFHRLPALNGVDGDRFSHVFAVPLEFRRKYPPTLNNAHHGKEWWAVCKGYEIGVFCDSWAYIHALTNPVNGFQKKAATWRQAVAYYNEYERTSNTHRYIL